MLDDTTILEMYRGDTKTFVFTVTENDDPIDLTGLTVRFAVRDAWPDGSVDDDADAVIYKTTAGGAGITLTDPSNGEFEVEIDPVDTYALDIPGGVKSFFYGIEYLESASHPVTIGRGTFLIFADVVRTV